MGNCLASALSPDFGDVTGCHPSLWWIRMARWSGVTQWKDTCLTLQWDFRQRIKMSPTPILKNQTEPLSLHPLQSIISTKQMNPFSMAPLNLLVSASISLSSPHTSVCPSIWRSELCLTRLCLFPLPWLSILTSSACLSGVPHSKSGRTFATNCHFMLKQLYTESPLNFFHLN